MFKRATSIAGVIVFGMTFVSGAVFPIAYCPTGLQSIGHAMPTSVRFRRTTKALFEGGGWYGDAAALLLFAAVALPCSVWLLSASLTKARRDGTLGQY